MNGKTFIRLCEDRFAPIKEKYSFMIRKKRKEIHSIDFINSYIDIEFRFDTRDRLVFVILTKLVDGKTLRDPYDPNPVNTLPSYDIGELLAIRVPELLDNNRMFEFANSEEDIVSMIEYNIELLETYATDMLTGNLEIFDEMEVEWMRKYGELPDEQV